MACELGEREIVDMLVTEESYETVISCENKQGQKPNDIADNKIINQVEAHVMQNVGKSAQNQRGSEAGGEEGRGRKFECQMEIMDHFVTLKQKLDDQASRVGENLMHEELKKDEREKKN